jgi:5-oxoprolinase (ATP-hydrolysing)
LLGEVRGVLATRGWNLWIDTGGTFTDCLAVDAGGNIRREKILSSAALRGTLVAVLGPRRIRIQAAWRVPANFVRWFAFRLLESPAGECGVESYDPAGPELRLDRDLPAGVGPGAPFEVRSPEEAPVLAARLVTGTPMGVPLPPLAMRLATTKATNALLERRGAPIAFFVTRGFGDLLRIGTQQRPDLFALDIRKPDPLARTVVEVPERLAADGNVVVPLDLGELAVPVSRLRRAGIRAAAVALLHSDTNPDHERQVGEFLAGAGFQYVSLSSELAPTIGILARAETAVVDATLAPIVAGYLDRVEEALPGGALHLLTSSGGVVRRAGCRAKDTLLSGPAGGVVGAALAGRQSGFVRVIAFDMGGTSTDVARFDGDYDYVFEHEVGDAHLVAPALAIESVAAGGGSICTFDGEELRVGPESAGADPGPACYGAGGPLTLTDVNLLLGRLDPARFDIPIRVEAARAAFDALLAAVRARQQEPVEPERLLAGLGDIANERMAEAIRRVSIRKGYDVADYALVAFGGAGGQHACAVAAHLGIDAIVIPADPGLLSAIGLGRAPIERFAERQVLTDLDASAEQIPLWIGELSRQALATLGAEGVESSRAEVRRVIFTLRLAGQDFGLPIDYDPATPLAAAFADKYRRLFGYWQEGRRIEVESIRVVAWERPGADGLTLPLRGAPTAAPTSAAATARAWFDGAWRAVPVYERRALAPGAPIAGPALVFEPYSVTVVAPGWQAALDAAGALILQRVQRSPTDRAAHPEVVRLELFTHRFETIAKQMGEMLQRTALSTNVKERLDFSCALLDANGELVVHAPHIPVHLGAMGMCVRGVRDVLPMRPGDVVVTNHPAYGGSHLPDVTVITPVHLPGEDSGALIGYVASRAHHAEIGGIRPGSMPALATRLVEEGVVIPPMHLYAGGEARWEEMQGVLTAAPFPTRALQENLADLRAAVAANRLGADALLALAAEHGADKVRSYMTALEARAGDRIRAALGRIPDGVYTATETLDDGSPLCVSITIESGRAQFDFTGSAGVHPGNLNATPAVVASVVLYVLRLLVREPLPLNEGLMHAVTMHVPPGILNPPFPADPAEAPAVVGGNVETSQRLTDTLLKALGLAACSQGTMNNVVFGTERYSYYETVCGGAGAGPGFAGASAVHTHMTNTRITDPEVLEHRYPVRVERFAIRPDSGGAGRHRGGDGVIRELTFLEPMSLSVLGQHRTSGPYGLDGGEAGKPAVQHVRRASRESVALRPADTCDVGPGDRFELETPGGGGYGR